jgi:hypothetical protein
LIFLPWASIIIVRTIMHHPYRRFPVRDEEICAATARDSAPFFRRRLK